MFGLGTTELIVIAVVILVLFGAGGIAQVARTLGQTRRELKQIQEEIQKPVQDIKNAIEEPLALTEPPLLVFISSVMNPECEDLKPERAAAKMAIESFPPLTRAWRFEDSPASPESASRVFLNKANVCDIMVLLVSRDVTRAVLKEYAVSRRSGKPCLVFLKRCDRTPTTQRFVERIRNYVKYREFSSSEDLVYQIRDALGGFLINQAKRFNLAQDDVFILTVFLDHSSRTLLDRDKYGFREARPKNELPHPEISTPRFGVVEVIANYSGRIPLWAPHGNGDFIWPVHGCISQLIWGWHREIDIAAEIGTPVKASESGYVIFAGWDTTGWGNVVLISHGHGFVTMYSQLHEIYARLGVSIARGQAIGRVGSTGRSTGPHLGFGLIKNGEWRDAREFVKGDVLPFCNQ